MGIEHTFRVEEPEEIYSLSSRPQILALGRSDGGLDVVAYFMMNTAFTITGSRVATGMGKTRLKVISGSESGVVCASVTLRKVRFGFDNPTGMATNFEIDVS